MHYNKNLSYFTYGQGGYFSPQQYVILNLPVEYTGRNGLFTYDVKGSIGVQHYRQDASNYFPTELQASRPAAREPDCAAPYDSGAVYPGQSKTGVSYSFSAAGEYQLAPQLAVGATASLGNAYQYREWLAAVYVRYSFTKQSGFAPFPPDAAWSRLMFRCPTDARGRGLSRPAARRHLLPPSASRHGTICAYFTMPCAIA